MTEESVGPRPVLTKASNSERPPTWPRLPHRHLGITPPPSVNDFRWRDDYLKLSCPVTSKDVTIVHRTKYSGEPHHGKMHTLLVPALEEFLSRLDEHCLKKSLGSETLKTASFSSPQTTHSHQVRRIQQNRLKNKKGDYRLPNRGDDLQG